MLVAFFLKGVAVGIVIAVPVGPVGVLCVRRAIFEGSVAGLVSGLGAATGDAVFGIVAAFGLTFVADWLLDYQSWLRAAGGCYLIGIGGWALVAGPRPIARPRDRESLLGDWVSTFALTLTNPITIVAFLGIFAALGLGGRNASFGHAAILVLGVWAGSLAWWLLLCFAVARLFRSVSRRGLAWINRGSGLILLLSGAALIASLAVGYLR